MGNTVLYQSRRPLHSCDKHTSGHWKTAREKGPFISNAGSCCGDAPRAVEIILEDMTSWISYHLQPVHYKPPQRQQASECSVTNTSQYIIPDTANSHAPQLMFYAPSCTGQGQSMLAHWFCLYCRQMHPARIWRQSKPRISTSPTNLMHGKRAIKKQNQCIPHLE